MKKKVIIFGCGYHGRAAFRKIQNTRKLELIYWVDSNDSLKNSYLFRKKIIDLQSLKEIKFDKIIFCGRHIKDQLKSYYKLNLNKKKIIIWDSFQLRPSREQIEKRDVELYKILKDVINKLNKNKIPYWADTSGLLTLIRKDNISILSDFDLGFDKKYSKKLFSIFKKEKKYKIMKGSYIRKNKIPKIAFLSKNKKKSFEPAVLDCLFYYKKKRTIYRFGNNRIKFPAKYIEKIDSFKFKDLLISVPSKSKEYLSHLYGKNFTKKVKFYSNPFVYKYFKIKKKTI